MAQEMDPKEKIARRVAQEMRDGYYVNLGVGIPVMVADYIPKGMEVIFQAENGMLGIGPYPEDECQIDLDLINAAKEPVTEVSGTSYFDSGVSFTMIRGGHMDLTVLGGMQVAENGDLANWAIPGKKLRGAGGAMDLVSGAKRVIIAMEHTSKDGKPKILKECTFPYTGLGVVNLIVTELAVIEVTAEGLVLREVAPGVTPEEVQKVTEPKLKIAEDLKTISI